MNTSREGKDLIAATRPFAHENPVRSRNDAIVTFALLALAATASATLHPWPLRASASVLQGLLTVRAFILFHDVMHGALLRGSRPWRAVFSAYGVLVLTPPTVWRATHNYHHAHTAKIVGSHIGSYPMLTTDLWRRATRAQRIAYRLTRHPLNILFGYATVFLYGMCLAPFLRAPRKHWDGAAAIVVHVGLSAALYHFAGTATLVAAYLAPLAIACALGGYLFYAQHNFPDAHVQPRETWEYARAALESSSYMAMGPLMAFFTGNIGYHHVHHLNPGVPFYRLPEAMRALPELQHPGRTSLRPADVIACFRLNLWDPARGRMVSYQEAARRESTPEGAVHAA